MIVDLVYLWVDGSDSQWQARKDEALQNLGKATNTNTKGRYENHDELKYSIRSVEKYLPWVRNIYIVTDNQRPEWLDENNSRIKIIDHKDILPSSALPCFNSVVIEYYIYKIQGLSEHFLYANDDMFVNKALEPSFFFHKNKLPIVRLQRQTFQKLEYRLKKLLNISINNYRLSIKNAIELIEQRYGKYYPGVLHHNIDAYRKSDFKQLVEETFQKEIEAISNNQFRSPSDIQRVLIAYEMLARKQAILKYVKRSESLRLKVHKGNFEALLEKYNPALYCINDTEHATDEDRKKIREFLEENAPSIPLKGK